MANFWNLIVQSNTFNFIIMLVIFTMLWQKLDITSKIEAMKLEITEFIEKSKREKELANQHLQDAEKSVANLDNEIKEKLDKSKLMAQNVFDEIQDMANKSIEKIEANVDKIISNETRKVNTKLSHSTADNAISLATTKLQEMFAQNPELHNQYINDSIETLDRVLWTK